MEVFNDSAADRKRLELKKNKLADQKLLNTILSSNITAICNKYGLMKENNTIYFKNKDTMFAFFKKAFEETVIKDFKENGIEVNLNRRLQRISDTSPLFRLDNMRVNLKDE